jgi:hypothetical protein
VVPSLATLTFVFTDIQAKPFFHPLPFAA